jgi:hypothetical protein
MMGCKTSKLPSTALFRGLATVVLVGLISLLLSSGVDFALAMPRAQEFHNVIVGDVVVSRPGKAPVFRTGEGRQSISLYLDLERDPRFQNQKLLKFPTVVVRENAPNVPLPRYEELVRTSSPEPSLYPVPNFLTVFKNPLLVGAIIIKLDGYSMYGRQIFIQCGTILSGERKEELAVRQGSAPRICRFYVEVTKRVSIAVAFDDRKFPPAEWVSVVASLESILPKIISRKPPYK